MSTLLVCPRCQSTSQPEDRFCAACGYRLAGGATPLPADPLLERLRDATFGSYDIHSELGRGGMAAVYLAYDLRLHRKVAIKVMLPELMASQGMADRFLLEARTAARLSHPNIVVIHSVSQADDLSYFVMALIEGATLEDLLHAEQVDPLAMAGWVVSQAARALAHAHGEGVVHRDVKPANILVNTRGDVFLTDFGIAKASEAQSITRTGSAVGTPSYMSPEQVMADEITGAADQYALGIVAYELLSGRQPFRGSVYEVQWAHVHRVPQPLREIAPHVPQDVADAVMRMLAKRPSDRWPSLEPVAELFQQALSKGSATTRSALAGRATSLQNARTATRAPTPHSPVPATLDRSRARASGIGDRPASLAPIEPIPAPAQPPATQTHADAGASAVDEPPHQLHVGETLALDIESDMESDGSAIRFESTDTSIIAVDASGIVTAVGRGNAAVVILADDSILRVRFTVLAATTPETPLRAVPDSLALEAGDSARVRVEEARDNGTAVSVKASWRSDDPTIATVDAEGAVTARSPGTVRLDGSVDGRAVNVLVRVLPPVVARVVVSPSSVRIATRGTLLLRAEARDRRDAAIAGVNHEYRTARPDVVKVDATGLLTAIAPGETTVTVTCGAASTIVPVAVEAAAVAAISLTPQALRLETGVQHRLSARLADGAGVALEGRTIRWSSTDEGVASVDTAGLVTALRSGDTRVSATVGTVSAAIPVTVVAAPIVELRTDTRSVRLVRGRRRPIVLRAIDARGNGVDAPRVEWQSANASVAHVEAGEIVALAEGATRLTARLGTIAVEMDVHVEPVSIDRLDLAVPERIAVGGRRRATATVYATDGEIETDAAIAWDSENPAVATVTPEGTLHAVAPGSTSVIASSGGKRALASVTVVAAASRTPLLVGGGILTIAVIVGAVLLSSEDAIEPAPPSVVQAAPDTSRDTTPTAPPPQPLPARTTDDVVSGASIPDSALTVAQLPLLSVNDTVALTARIDGQAAPSSRVRVSSRNIDRVAVVAGRLVARAPGVARLDVSVGSRKATVSVAVSDARRGPIPSTTSSPTVAGGAAAAGRTQGDSASRAAAPVTALPTPAVPGGESVRSGGAAPATATNPGESAAAAFTATDATALVPAVLSSLRAGRHAMLERFYSGGSQFRAELEPGSTVSLTGDRAQFVALLSKTNSSSNRVRVTTTITFRLARLDGRVEFRDVVASAATPR